MTQATQSTVLWSIGILAVVMILTAFFVTSSINTNANDAAADVAKQLDNKIDTKFDSYLSEFKETTSALQNLEDVEVDPSLCNNIDGCNGLWDVKDTHNEDGDSRDNVVNRVLEELNENNKKDLFRLMERNGIDIDDNEDTEFASSYKEGEILTNQDPRFGFDEDRITTADIVIEVKYTDGDGHDRTDYFRVQATLDELENGYEDGDVSIDDFNEVRKRFVLPSR